MPTLPDHHLGADLKQQHHLPEIPTPSLSLMSQFFLFSADAPISPRKNTAAASPMDAQISGELCRTATAVSKHTRKCTLQVENAFPIPIYL